MDNGKTEEFIDFLTELTLEEIPAGTLDQTISCVIDAVGCGLFGSDRPWTQMLFEEMAEEEGKGISIVFGRQEKLTAAAAALCNGTAIHGFEFDDLIASSVMHPAATVIPAALAAAEATRASGAQFLLGVVAGYETMHRVGLGVGLEPIEKGFHATSLIAPIAATVAAGVVRNLGRDEMLSALGLACSSAAGIKSFADGMGGGMVKRLHLGRAAEAGVRLSSLAGRGFSGPPCALQSRFGLFNVFGSDRADPDQLTLSLGKKWAVDEVWFKVYPICGWIHTTAQVVSELCGRDGLSGDDIRQIRVGVSAYAARNNGEKRPVDTMGAQYSIPYCVAAAVLGDARDPAIYASEKVNDPQIRKLAARVELYQDMDIEADYPAKFGTHVTMELTSGEVREDTLLECKGTPANPCTLIERDEKFQMLSRGVLSKNKVDEFLLLAQKLPEMSDLDKIGATLLPGSVRKH